MEKSAVFDAGHVREFTRMTGDGNPIHTSSAAAQAQGTHTQSVVSDPCVHAAVRVWHSEKATVRPRRPMQAFRTALFQEFCVHPCSRQLLDRPFLELFT